VTWGEEGNTWGVDFRGIRKKKITKNKIKRPTIVNRGGKKGPKSAGFDKKKERDKTEGSKKKKGGARGGQGRRVSAVLWGESP